MSKLLKDLVELSDKRERKIIERFEDYSADELYQEIMAQYKNLEVYKPQNVEELNRTSGAIVGTAEDLIRAVRLLSKVKR